MRKGKRRENGRLSLAVVTLIHLLSSQRLNNFFCDSALGPSKTNNTLCGWWATSNLTAILMESIIRERGRNNGRAPHLLITLRAIITRCDHQTSSFFFYIYFLFFLRPSRSKEISWCHHQVEFLLSPTCSALVLAEPEEMQASLGSLDKKESWQNLSSICLPWSIETQHWSSFEDRKSVV